MTAAPVPADVSSAIDVATLLADASPAVMFALFIFALLRGWLVLPREVTLRDKRIAELEAERNEYRLMTFRALNVGERVAAVVEGGRAP